MTSKQLYKYIELLQGKSAQVFISKEKKKKKTQKYLLIFQVHLFVNVFLYSVPIDLHSLEIYIA